MNGSESHQKTVLLVEDNLDIREIFQEVLELEGYRVITAENGEEGLKKVHYLPKPNVVLLDMMMPIMDGHDFLERVHDDPAVSKIPVVVVSANADAKNAEGATGFMRKPVDLDALLMVVALHSA